MKMHIYLSVIVCVMVFGFVMTNFRDKQKINSTAYYNYSDPPQHFQELGAFYAEKTRTGPIAEWQVYGGAGYAVMVDGIDSEGEQILKCVFDKKTGCPLSILRVSWKGIDLSDVPKGTPRQVAEWWLKRIIPLENDKWHWVQDGSSSSFRYLSVWHCATYNASLSVNAKTGRMLALRLSLPSGEHGKGVELVDSSE